MGKGIEAESYVLENQFKAFGLEVILFNYYASKQGFHEILETIISRSFHNVRYIYNTI